jgi:hypothetical protein
MKLASLSHFHRMFGNILRIKLATDTGCLCVYFRRQAEYYPARFALLGIGFLDPFYFSLPVSLK